MTSRFRLVWLGLVIGLFGCGESPEYGVASGSLPVSALRTTHQLAGMDWDHAYNISTLLLAYLRMTKELSGELQTTGRLRAVDAEAEQFVYEATGDEDLEVDFVSEPTMRSLYVVGELDFYGRPFQGAVDFFFPHHIEFRYIVPGWMYLEVDSHRTTVGLRMQVQGVVEQDDGPVHIHLVFSSSNDAPDQASSEIVVEGRLTGRTYDADVDQRLFTRRSDHEVEQTTVIESIVYAEEHVFEYADVQVSQRYPLVAADDQPGWMSEVSGHVLMDGMVLGDYQLVHQEDTSELRETVVQLVLKNGRRIPLSGWVDGR